MALRSVIADVAVVRAVKTATRTFCAFKIESNPIRSKIDTIKSLCRSSLINNPKKRSIRKSTDVQILL